MVEHILLMVECVSVFCTTFALVIKTNSIILKSATIIQYTIKGRFMSR